MFQLISFYFSVWQEPHPPQDIVKLSSTINIIPIEQHVSIINNLESSSFMKYIEEYTNVDFY